VPELTPRRREILDAAVEVLADQGLKGLTHRAVDRRAGLSEGSSSAYFRSRESLQHAVAEHVAARLADDVAALADELAGTSDHQMAIDRTGALFHRWLARPQTLTARLELTLAATRDPGLAERMRDWREQLVATVAQMLAESGRAQPAQVAATAVAALDGLLLAGLQLPPRRRTAFLRDGVATLLDALADPATTPRA
jgi:DNA-binding transcriptional regulator YbjK